LIQGSENPKTPDKNTKHSHSHDPRHMVLLEKGIAMPKNESENIRNTKS
jgi:hypothetical protein